MYAGCRENTILNFPFFFSCLVSGPLVGIEKRIRSGLEYIESNYSDDYISGKRYSQFDFCYCLISSYKPSQTTRYP